MRHMEWWKIFPHEKYPQLEFSDLHLAAVNVTSTHFLQRQASTCQWLEKSLPRVEARASTKKKHPRKASGNKRTHSPRKHMIDLLICCLEKSIAM